jgi:hypothetical protein
MTPFTFVSTVVEDIERLHCCWPFLFVSEDEVDPVVDVRGDVLRLQGFPVFVDEVLGGLGPLGKNNMVYPLLTTLKLSKVKICQKLPLSNLEKFNFLPYG